MAKKLKDSSNNPVIANIYWNKRKDYKRLGKGKQ